MPKQTYVVKYITLVALLLILPGCGTMGASISGKVIDKSTGQPIEGAIVLAYWEGSVMNPIHDTRTCFHVESTTSNKKGKFRIPFWVSTPKGIVDQEVSTVAYKQGYQRAWGQQSLNEKYLVPFTGMLRGGRLEYLKRISGFGCTSDEFKELLPYIKAIYKEASEIAIEKEDKEILNSLRYKIDLIELGSEETTKRIRQGWYEK